MNLERSLSSLMTLLVVASPAFAMRTGVSSALAVAPVQATPTPARRKTRRGRLVSHYSRGNEEIIVREYFHDMRDGSFLDVGCWHAIQASNTYYLEKWLGWSGVAVDALPELAPEWRKIRKRSMFFNYLVTDKAETKADFYRAAFSDISSSTRPTTGPGGNPVASWKISVPSITLNELLARAGVTRIDFMSMDIEGAEAQALAGLDLKRFKVGLACVEAKVSNRKAISDYFKRNGYRRLTQYEPLDRTNWYFAPASGPGAPPTPGTAKR